MILRRLTKIQKDEIVEAYRGGQNSITLAKKYNCSSNTINRTVKTLLSESEYKLLKRKRIRSSNIKVESVDIKSSDIKQEDLEQTNYLDSPQEKVDKKTSNLKSDSDFYDSSFEEIAFLPMSELSSSKYQNDDNSDMEIINEDVNDTFEELVPLSPGLDLEKKESDFEILNQDFLPESVYMLVDKKVELDVKSLSDLPEWRFLPENELQRNAILLFLNQRTAKRSCSKNQRVIKIPNTNIFQLSKSYLISKGITRLILEDSIIGLDN